MYCTVSALSRLKGETQKFVVVKAKVKKMYFWFQKTKMHIVAVVAQYIEDTKTQVSVVHTYIHTYIYMYIVRTCIVEVEVN